MTPLLNEMIPNQKIAFRKIASSKSLGFPAGTGIAKVRIWQSRGNHPFGEYRMPKSALAALLPKDP
jgi:hypothetical protein